MTETLPSVLVRIAIYARYSCDQQRETSIDDQIRRCKEIAEYLGLQVSECLVFTDSALSGQAHALEKREGLHQLDKAWQEGAFDILMLDAFERLARDGMEQEKLIQRLKANRRVRLITCDGIDTSREGWELLLRLKGAISQAEISSLQHRVGRGMVGQLERGYMIATPAFGYDLKREFDAQGNRIGTRWVINPDESILVRQIFQRRKDGQSMHQIALWMNQLGIPCSRKAETADGGFWRQSRVRNLLTNPIYKGLFIWHGSTTFKNRAAKRGDTVKERHYARPELRLVSDETWELCNAKKQTRSKHGGGKNALAGLLTCGCCGGTLVLTVNSSAQSLYCASCTSAKACARKEDRLSVTVATVGVKKLLTKALSFFLTPEFVRVFRQALHDKLTASPRHEYEACEKELKRLLRSQARLGHMLANIDGDDDILQERYEETRRLARAAEAQLALLRDGKVEVDQEAVAAQMAIDPAVILGKLFEASLPPEQLRAMLRRLFPSIVLEGKDGRYRSFFRLQFAAGAALALASDTVCQIDESMECRFQLRYVPDNRTSTGPYWEVTALDREWLDAIPVAEPVVDTSA